MSPLEEAKEFAREYLKKQLEMVEKLSSLNDDDVTEFNRWFKTEPMFTSLPLRMFELNQKRIKA